MQSYSAVEFDALAEKYASLNWRLVSKPGGATVKPDDFYVLYGCASQSDYLKPTFCCHMECCTLVGWAVTSGVTTLCADRALSRDTACHHHASN